MRDPIKHFGRSWAVFFAVGTLALAIAGQSSDQSFPTPVRSNEVSGTIRARDIGDSRLTSHFYTFEGAQGDLFINVQTTNFSGDIDIFVIPGLRPLTKMVMYADASTSETGRVVYLRKPETILLRVEGRTPSDEEATYRIKFAGSFVASRAADEAPETPKVNSETQSNVRVNSVGTIIEIIPKSTPAPKEESLESAEKREEKRSPEKAADAPVVKDRKETVSETPAKREVRVTDPLADIAKDEAAAEAKPSTQRRARNRRSIAKVPPVKKERSESSELQTVSDAEKASPPSSETKTGTPKSRSRTKTAKPQPEEAIDPMTGINLVIRFKDGSVIERPMTDVLRFSVERAVLTVISKNGTIGRYQMVEVAGVTIE